MGRLIKRLNELEKRQDLILTQLKRLDEIVAKRVVLRELTDVKIRIRNLQKNCKKSNDLQCVVAEKDCNIIATEDDEFDPELVELNTTRPQMRMYPTTPSPHSQRLWPRFVRVARSWPDLPLPMELGQFTGVEEEEKEKEWSNCFEEESKLTNFKEENYLTENEEKKHFQGCVAFKYASTLSEVKEEIFQAEEDTQIKGPVVTHTSGEGPSIDDMDLAQMKTMFSLEKIAASAGQSSSSSEIITDSSNDDEDILESEKDEEVLTKIKCRVDEEMINRVIA